MRKKKSGRIKDDKTCFQHLVKPEEKLEKNLKKLKKLLGVDSLPGNRKAQEIFLKFAHQKLQEKGGLEWLLQEKKRLLAQLAETERFSDEYLDSIARKAIFNGYIQVLHLADILGAEEDYGDVLPILWKDFECNRNGRKIETDTPYKRTGAWNKLLRRFTGMGSIPPEGRTNRYWADPVLGELPPVMRSYLNLYNRDPATGELKIKPIKDRCDIDFIKLEDLPEYFGQIQRDCKVNLSLPKRLFSEALEKKREATKEAEKSISNDYEDFVRKLRVWYQNDSEIKIQVPEKPAKLHKCEELGFRDNTTKAWNFFLEILRDPNHFYNLGPAHKTKARVKQRVLIYDNRRKILGEINSKWIGFISKNYKLQAPKGFKIYEKRKCEGSGAYGFKFQIIDEKTRNKKDQLSDVELRLEIKNLSKKYKENPQNEGVYDRLVDLGIMAKERGLLTERELEDMIQSHRTMDLETKGGEFKHDRNENRDSEQGS